MGVLSKELPRFEATVTGRYLFADALEVVASADYLGQHPAGQLTSCDSVTDLLNTGYLRRVG